MEEKPKRVTEEKEKVAKIKVPVEPGEEMVPAKERPRHGNPYKLAIAILSLAVLAMAATIIYLLFCPSSPKNDNPTTPNDPPVAQECPAQNDTCAVAEKNDKAVREIVAAVKTAVEEKMTPYKLLVNTYDESAPVYRPEGMETGIPLTKNYGFMANAAGFSVQSEQYRLIHSTDYYETITKVLTEKGFVDTEESYTLASAGKAPTTFMNEETGVVCAVSSLPDFSCAYKTWYSEKDADFSNSLAKVYKEATGEDAYYLVAKEADVKDSPVEPYQTISVAMTGAGAIFYRVSPTSEWVYFSRGQMAPLCSAYNTDNLKKAFAGQTCYDDVTQKNSTVQQ